MRGWKAMQRRLAALPKFNRFWRLTTRRAVHHAVANPANERGSKTADIPAELLRKAWLAKILNEDVMVEHYDSHDSGWQKVFYWPARKLPAR